MGERIAKLTEKQRECLRLVLLHKSSKEIARELGIGVDAVDQRIKSAMKTLGVSSRIEAARLLAQADTSAQPIAASHLGVDAPLWDRQRFWLLLVRRVGRWIPRTRRGRFLLCSAVVGVVFASATGLSVIGRGPLDSYLIHRWEKSHPRPASGDIVLVALDAKSMEVLGPLPWPRETIARLVRQLDRAGARRVAFDTFFVEQRDPKGDQALAEAFRSMEYRIILPVEVRLDPVTGNITQYYPLPEFRRRADLVQLIPAFESMFSNNYDRYSYFIRLSDRSIPALPLFITNRSPPYWEWGENMEFPINFSIDPFSIPKLSAIDVIYGTANVSQIRGKEVLVARQDWHNAVPTAIGGVPGGYFHLLAAETLKRGPPWEIPWWLAITPALIIIAFCGRRRDAIRSAATIGIGIGGTLLAAWLLEPYQIYLPMTAPIALLTFVGAGLSWAWLRRRFANRRAMARNPA